MYQARRRQVDLVPFFYVYRSRWFRSSKRPRRGRGGAIQLQSDSDFVVKAVSLFLYGPVPASMNFVLANPIRFRAGDHIPIEITTDSAAGESVLFQVGFVRRGVVVQVTNLHGRLDVSLAGWKVFRAWRVPKLNDSKNL